VKNSLTLNQNGSSNGNTTHETDGHISPQLIQQAMSSGLLSAASDEVPPTDVDNIK
jgi:hypothetical protein